MTIISKGIYEIGTSIHFLPSYILTNWRNFVRYKYPLNDTIDIMRSNFLDGHITIHKNYNFDEKTTLVIDSLQVQQALLNILQNAMEAMPEGGDVWINAHCDDKNFTIAIKDSGPGIPKNILPHIFDPFYGIKEDKTGLGLSIAKDIIENHQGRITVRTEINMGSEFIISLPLTEKK